ncbi:Protein kinase-like domain [Pseudocohnilembus persalinus]|uniref:Protein kinase-like domain n=1 Tax=Pseudocohnilembus persalinus TaxID=266149 RepID=A0A0V0QFF8_PSEPJ|nr:Protein kinase-like domain [Pseudocohnilembus persalinus]|eukprot:KRX00908.1 Protein kinase-like domain [Pseudocohnilembus persalinus]
MSQQDEAQNQQQDQDFMQRLTYLEDRIKNTPQNGYNKQNNAFDQSEQFIQQQQNQGQQQPGIQTQKKKSEDIIKSNEFNNQVLGTKTKQQTNKLQDEKKSNSPFQNKNNDQLINPFNNQPKLPLFSKKRQGSSSPMLSKDSMDRKQAQNMYIKQNQNPNLFDASQLEGYQSINNNNNPNLKNINIQQIQQMNEQEQDQYQRQQIQQQQLNFQKQSPYYGSTSGNVERDNYKSTSNSDKNSRNRSESEDSNDYSNDNNDLKCNEHSQEGIDSKLGEELKNNQKITQFFSFAVKRTSTSKTNEKFKSFQNKGNKTELINNKQQKQYTGCEIGENYDMNGQNRGQSSNTASVSENQAIRKMSEELQKKNEIIKQKEQQLLKIKQTLASKQNELEMTSQFYNNYQEKVKQITAQSKLELEQYKRNERKQEILVSKSRLGQIGQQRDGTQFKDIWIDESMKLQNRREHLEREKLLLIQKIKLDYEESNCRFGKNDLSIQEQWPLLQQRYQLLSLLGKGGFSEVYKGFDLVDMIPVACKIHQLNPNWSEQSKNSYVKHAVRESRIHQQFKHPNIVKLYDSVEIDQDAFSTVLEYCEGPDLAYYLKEQKALTEKEAKVLIKQIVSGLKYMHSFTPKVIHYDLKPQNILFHKGQLKISDFGLSKVMMENNETRMELTSQGVGTYWYLPPETFLSESQSYVGTKVDVWSLGVIFYEMIYGKRPFGNGMSQSKILEEKIILKSTQVQFPQKSPVQNFPISKECQDFIRRCLTYRYEDRWDIKEISNSPYLQKK